MTHRFKAIFFVMLLALSATLPETVHAQPFLPNYKSLANLPVVDVTAAPFNAKGNGVANDAPAIQAAINAAALKGGNIYKGGVVYFPSGTYLINAPLVLPRTTNARTPVVHLVGDNSLACMIVGGASFPPTRGLVEWAATTTTVWHGRIAHLGFKCPSGVGGVRAIWHKSNKAGGLQAGGTTIADVMTEWFQCDMEDLYFEGTNKDNEVFIDLEVGNRYAKMWNLIGDPSRGILAAGEMPAYDTLLIRTAYQYAGTDPISNEDSVGLFSCNITGLQSMILQGGWVRMFQGRIGNSRWDTSFNNGPLPGRGGVGFAFYNSFATSLNNLSNEGGGGRCQMLFSNCRTIIGHNLYVPVGIAAGGGNSAQWLATHAYSLGDRVIPTRLYTGALPAPTNRIYTVTTAGTSGGTEPTWNDTGTTTDGTAVYTASSGQAASDGIILENCEGCHFDTHHADPAWPPASYRRTKTISIDANSRNNKFEGWGVRGIVSGGFNTVGRDVAPEMTILGTANSVSGEMVQGFGSWRIPFTVGLDPQSLDAVATYRGDENLLEAPTAFENGFWVRTAIGTVTADATTDPLGQTRADKIVESATTAQHALTQQWTRGAVLRQQTFSIYLKAAERTTADLYLTDNVGFLKLACNLTTGVVTPSVLVAETGMTLDASGSADAGNGWWRVQITGTLPAATSVSKVFIFPNNNTSYAGNGTSGIYAFGAQLENAATASVWREPNPTLYVGVDAPIQRMDAAMTANRTVSFSTAGAYNGAWFEIVQTGGGAFTRAVGGLKTIPVSTDAKVRVTYDGTAWRLTTYAADTDALIATKAATGHTHVLANVTDAGTAASKTAGNAVGNVPMVESGGTLNASIIPSVPATHVYVDATQAAMLAHGAAVVGDISKRTDLGTSFILSVLPSSTLGNWITITDASSVTTVNGLSGAVVLGTGDLSETGGKLFYTTARTNTDAPNVTLTAGADAAGLSLTGQQIGVDNFTAHYFWAGPTAGGAAAPGPRLIDATDLPSHTHIESEISGLVADLAAKVPTARIINTNSPLTGGGSLSSDLTLGVAGATTSAPGSVELATLAEADAQTDAARAVTPSGLVNRVFTSRLINTTAPLTGGGDLTSNRTLGVDAATATATGVVELATLAEADAQTDTVRAVTPADLVNRMPTSWTLTATAPITGGGSGAANRSIGISAATSAAAGSMSATDKAKLDAFGFVNAGTIATNYTPDVATGDVFEITLGAATVTINAPTNPTNGKKVLYRLKQDATGNRAVAWNAVFRFGTDITATTLTTTASKTDYVGTVYDGTAAKWDVVSFVKGY